MGAKTVGLRETRAWLLKLRAGIPRSISNEISSPEALAEMEASAKDVVRDVVYSVPETENYKRKRRFLNAVEAYGKSGPTAIAGVGINTDKAHAIATGRDISYPRYFLPDDEATSFHHYELPRDFLVIWLAVFSESIPARVLLAVDKELHR